MNPYQPPASRELVASDTRVCPECGANMISGEITGSVYWNDKGTSIFRRFLSRGRSLMGGSVLGITLKAQRLAGFRCGACGLVMFVEGR
jgi:ribosomal protein S27AE